MQRVSPRHVLKLCQSSMQIGNSQEIRNSQVCIEANVTDLSLALLGDVRVQQVSLSPRVRIFDDLTNDAQQALRFFAVVPLAHGFTPCSSHANGSASCH